MSRNPRVLNLPKNNHISLACNGSMFGISLGLKNTLILIKEHFFPSMFRFFGGVLVFVITKTKTWEVLVFVTTKTKT